jgi:hypothetical protein
MNGFGFGATAKSVIETVTIITSSENCFDADASLFIDVGITGYRQQVAINDFVRLLKGQTTVLDVSTPNKSMLWDRIVALYPYCPINDSSFSSQVYSYNLKSPQIHNLKWVNFTANDFTINDVSGGTGKYARTGIIPNQHLNLSNVGITAYSRSNQAVTNNVCMGAINASTQRLGMNVRNGTNIFNSFLNSGTAGATTDNNLGLMDADRLSNSQISLSRNGVLLSNIPINVGSRPTVEIYLHAENSNGNLANPDTRHYAGFAVRQSFNAQQLVDWNFAWKYYQTNVVSGGRNVV